MEGALHWRVLKSQENSGPVCRKLSALPAALTDLVLVVGVMLFYLAFHIREEMLSTICTGIMGIVGLMMVYQTSRPFNALRKAMMEHDFL